MQTLTPTAVRLNNLSGSAADLDDSPDAPDGAWCVRLGVTAQCVTNAAYVSARGTWETNMVSYGEDHAAYLAGGASQNEKLEAVYYDGQWIFQQIATYLNEATPWTTAAENARIVYIENYCEPTFNAQGYRRFPHGPYFDWLASGNSTIADIQKLRDNPSFSALSEYAGAYLGSNQNMSREMCYALQANIYAEKAGETRKTDSSVSRPGKFVEWAENHFRQWKEADYEPEDPAPRFAPFMAGLWLHALSEWVDWEEENDRDPNATWTGHTWANIDTMFGDFLVWMRDTALVRDGTNVGQRMYLSSGGEYVFRYQDVGSDGDQAPAWDLNNLIGYSYAWYANRIKATDPTEAQELMETADELFIGAALNGYFYGAKQYNELMRLSFKYVAIHDASGLGYCTS